MAWACMAPSGTGLLVFSDDVTEDRSSRKYSEVHREILSAQIQSNGAKLIGQCFYYYYFLFIYLSHTRLYRDYITSSDMYSLHLTHPKWTHTRSSGQPCYSARGAVGGSVPCSRTPQSWYWRRREHWLFTPPTNNPCQTRDSNPQPLDYESNSLTIRPRLPHSTNGQWPKTYRKPTQEFLKIKKFIFLFCNGQVNLLISSQLSMHFTCLRQN